MKKIREVGLLRSLSFGIRLLSIRIRSILYKHTFKWDYFGKEIEIGKNVRFDNWHSELHNKVKIEDYVILGGRGKLIIGENTSLNPYCFIIAEKKVQIGKNCMIAPNVYIADGGHIHSKTNIPIKSQGGEHKEVIIEDNVWLGRNATILSGVKIGRDSIVAAGAVVTKDVAPFSIVGGVPAKEIRKRR